MPSDLPVSPQSPLFCLFFSKSNLLKDYLNYDIIKNQRFIINKQIVDFLVEMVGFEPMAFAMRTQRSPN